MISLKSSIASFVYSNPKRLVEAHPEGVRFH